MTKRIAFCITCLFLISLGPVSGQTTSQIRETYGPPIEAYPVSEHIWMTPQFTADGQVCLMRLYPKRISDTLNYLGQDKLHYWELKGVLEQLAPAQMRGKPNKVLWSHPLAWANVADNLWI